MWKLRITYKKKSKKKVDQFKFETPTPSQVDELTPTQTSIQPLQKIEPFKNIELDSTLYELLKQWAANNNINNRKSYFSYITTNPTITLNGRTFQLPKNIANTNNNTILNFLFKQLINQIGCNYIEIYCKCDFNILNQRYPKIMYGEKDNVNEIKFTNRVKIESKVLLKFGHV